MLQNCHCLADAHAHHGLAPAARRSPPAPISAAPTISALRKIYEAFREALAAWREYERLRSSGLAHDAALRESLGIGPAQRACGTTKPLHFAGRA
jgi:hypothetical protein